MIEGPLLRQYSHDHGKRFRAKIVPFGGPVSYSEWFPSESDLRQSMETYARRLGARYYCEMQKVTCDVCNVDDHVQVIATL